MRLIAGSAVAFAVAVLAATPAVAQHQAPPDPSSFGPPPAQLGPQPPGPEVEPTPAPLPAGVTATATPPRTLGSVPNSQRWVTAHFQPIGHAHSFYTRWWLRFSCERRGRAAISVREHARWQPPHVWLYYVCPRSHAEAMSVQVNLGNRPRHLRDAIRMRMTFVEGRQTTHTVLTMRRAQAGAQAHAAAGRVWWDGQGTCQRSGSGTGAQIVVSVEPSATFGQPYGTQIQWESWMLVYNPRTSVAEWIEHPAKFFTYTALEFGSGSSPYRYLEGGGAIWTSGGSAADGLWGNQSWFFRNGLWVRPAIVIRYRDWNYVHWWDIQPAGMLSSSGTWCQIS
jgi:hypothetical protein